MSENIPESIPRSADRRSQRPTKRARGPATAAAAQSSAVEQLFARPDREVHIPEAATKALRRAGDMAPPPEIVANVQGSSAGAGSGEFHVYKASRRRELERVRLMEEEARREDADAAWAARQEQLRLKDAAERSKNAKKREKAKARKKGAGAKAGNAQGDGKAGGDGTAVPEIRRGLAPALTRREEGDDEDEAVDGANGMAGHGEGAPAAHAEPGVVIHDDDD